MKAIVAGYRFMGAFFTMLINLADVITGVAAIGTIDKDLFTGFQYMFFELVKRDLRLGAVIGAPEHGSLQDRGDDEMKVTLFTKLTIARVAGVSSLGVLRRFRKSTIYAS